MRRLGMAGFFGDHGYVISHGVHMRDLPSDIGPEARLGFG